MTKASPFRELFHEFPNIINGINVISYTYAFNLKELDSNKLKINIKQEISDKLDEIEDYCKRADGTIESISEMLNKANSANEAKDKFISAIDNELKAINKILNNIKTLHQQMSDINYKGKALDISGELYKLEPRCHTVAGIFKDFKGNLISLGIYYKK